MQERPAGPRIALDVQLRGSLENIFRRLIESAPDAIVVVDASGTVVFANAQTERLFGWSPEELIGQAIEALIPERFRGEHVDRRRQFASAPQLRPMGSGLELFGKRKDGSEFAVEISLSPLETDYGRLVSAAIRDVTERRKIEAAVRRANELLVNAVESFQGGFALFDRAGQLVMCNSGFRALLGQPLRGEIVGRRMSELFDVNLTSGVFELGDESADAFRARWAEYYAAPRGAFEVRLKNGHTVRLIDRPTPDSGRVSTILDISADVRLADELRSARAAAEAASSAKSEFLASMSHELRTPLNAILGFAQLLQRDKKTPMNERQLERLSHVVKGGEHLLHLIDEVLDLSRIEAGRIPISLEPVSVPEVIEEVRSTLDPMAARAEIVLTVRPFQPELPPILADRTRFAQILMNYGSNAIKYGKKGGTVSFQVGSADHTVRVSVADDGIGIPLEKHSAIFQPFQRAGQETGPIEGTGIGLTISKRLAEIMGGSVGFSSEPGRGSEFWIELPVHVEETRKEPTEIASAAADLRKLTGGASGRHLVLYVEDNPSNIAFMEDFLADFDKVALITAPTAEIGIELARVHRPEVVIMDINLPGMSGFEAAQKLREWPETASIPVIGLSAAAMVRDAKRVEAAGFVRYLTKPVKVDELASVLESLLLSSE